MRVTPFDSSAERLRETLDGCLMPNRQQQQNMHTNAFDADPQVDECVGTEKSKKIVSLSLSGRLSSVDLGEK